jgi:hypothetical protein
MKLKFNVKSSLTNYFTDTQAAKVDAGVEIFKQVISSDEFQSKVKNFQWRTSEGVAFNRFYLSNGMSNEQICDVICKGVNHNQSLINTVKETNFTVVNIVPCVNKQEAENCWNNTFTPCIGINTNLLNNTWYTPVHVACAIMHEWCTWNGFNCSPTTSKLESWSSNTVPVACSWVCKDVCATVCDSPEVANWCDQINNQTFDYCACSTTFNVPSETTNSVSPILKIDECINLLEKEMNSLTTCNDVIPDVTNRITVLSDWVKMMTHMKLKLCNTSIDGSDWTYVPVNAIATANAN